MKLAGKRLLCFVHDGFEDLELWYPVYRLREEGAVVDLAGEGLGITYTGKHGVPATANRLFQDADAHDYDGLLIPGGWAPDKLRRFKEVLDFTRDTDKAGKPIAQICHAGWVSISAGIIKGRRVTSTPAIKDDMINAGGNWVDEEVVVDNNLVSSRRPSDLPAYMRAFIGLF